MGWDFGYSDKRKADVVRSIRESASWEREGRGNRLLSLTVRGNVVWTLNEAFWPGDKPNEVWIGCHLTAKSDGCWGHKDMEESSHPYYYSCPLGYLDRAPVANEKWREGVRQYHAEKATSSFRKGDRVMLRNVGGGFKDLNGKTGVATGRRGSRVLVTMDNGQLLKAPRSCVARA